MTLLFFISFAVWPIASFGQLAFNDPLILAQKVVPSRMTSGDFDNNGLSDLAFTTQNDGSIHVLYNAGSLEFEETVITAGEGTYHFKPISSGDFNHDGKADLVYLDNNSGATKKVVVLLSNGSSFDMSVIEPSNLTLVSRELRVDDIDGDTHPDIVVPIQLGSLIFLKGDGTGDFEIRSIDIYNADFVTTGDANSDGRNDIFITGFFGLSVYLRQSNGSYALSETYEIGGYGGHVLSVDLNGDEFIDILMQNANQSGGGNSVLSMINDGSGHYSAVTVPTPDSQTIKGFDHLDFNNDGNEDIVIASESTYGLFIMENLDGMSFTNKAVVNPSRGTQSVATLDLDNDAVKEIVQISAEGTIDIFTYSAESFPAIGRIILTPQAIDFRIADMNNDGILDIVTGNLNSYTVSVLYGISALNFDKPEYFPVLFNSSVGSLEVRDFNEDGYPDILSNSRLKVDPFTRALYLTLSNGDGELGEPQLLNVNANQTMAVSDMDNDSHLDIITGNYVHFGDGTGAFPATVAFNNLNFDLVVVAIELNGDSLVDLLVRNFTQTYYSYNLGSRTFSVITATALPDNHSYFAVAKIDNDELDDLIAMRFNRSDVNIYFNRGNATFEGKSIALSPNSVSGRSNVGDFNQDGRMDLAIGVNGGIKLFLQEANGDFTYYATITKTGSIDQVFAVDMNGDNQPDIVTSSFNGIPTTIIVNQPVIEPTIAPSAMTIGEITPTSASITLIKGNGNGRIVIIRSGSEVTAIPTDATFYTSNPAFGMGQEIAPSQFVLLAGDQETVNVTGLNSTTTYYLSAFEYHSSNAPLLINYLTSPTASTSFLITGEENQRSDIQIFPNPANCCIYIQSIDDRLAKNAISVSDILGRQQFLEMDPQSHQLRLDARSLADGLYVVSVRTSSGVVQKKIYKCSSP